jgi:hypothetical protein
MSAHGETWANAVSCTLDDAGLDLPLGDGYSTNDAPHFTLWTGRRVYFPIMRGGDIWEYSVESASRNPDGIPMCPLGG